MRARLLGVAARWLCLLLASYSVQACRTEPTQERKLRAGPVGTLIGEVRLAPDAALPQYPSFDLARRPLHVSSQPPRPSECAEADEAARTPVTLTPEGLLRGVVVAASDFTRVHERKSRQHSVSIEHCRLRPSIVAAQGGDVLLLENHDDYPFQPLIGPAYRASALTRGHELKVPLAAAGIDSILCSLGAPCGRTDLLVFFHPVHTVTDDKGHFRIDNFPAGELVRVTAWHPLFEPAETFVWVDPGKEDTVRLRIMPKARFVPKQ